MRASLPAKADSEIGRVAHEGRRQGQDLPDPLTGGFEEIRPAGTGRRPRRRRCHRLPAGYVGCRRTPARCSALFALEDDYFQRRQGQGQAAVHRRDRRHAWMEGIGQFSGQAVCIDADFVRNADGLRFMAMMKKPSSAGLPKTSRPPSMTRAKAKTSPSA